MPISDEKVFEISLLVYLIFSLQVIKTVSRNHGNKIINYNTRRTLVKFEIYLLIAT